jgi:hypothetical protein
MKLGIMQPYFFPYIGYFQLISAVDLFIIYDNIKYTKKGWINRNRLLVDGTDAVFSLALKRGSDFLNVCDRELAEDFDPTKLLNKVAGAYRQAPYFEQTFSLIEHVLLHPDRNLFRFLRFSLIATCEHLGIKTKIGTSSDVAVDHNLKSQDKVLAMCEATGAHGYVNLMGGVDLYSRDEFLARGIVLRFIRSAPLVYKQFDNEFVPSLSIIDVMMFNSLAAIHERIENDVELI